MRFADQHYLWWELAVIPLALLFIVTRGESGRFSSHRFLKLFKRASRVSTAIEFVLFATIPALAIGIIARPQVAQLSETEKVVVRDIACIVDKSGSMKDPISDPEQLAAIRIQAAPMGAPDAKAKIRKIDAARICLKYFVPMRPHDRIGLFEFDSSTYVSWPLSPEHDSILAEVDKLGLSCEGSTNFEGPTERSPGIGCFQGGINHFREMQPGSETRFLIVLTDGEIEEADGLDKRRFLEIVSDLKAMAINLIIIGVGDSWTADPETDAKGRKTKDIRRLVKQVGGRLFTVGDSRQMKDAFKAISDSTPTVLRTEKVVEWGDIYPQLALATAVAVLVLFGYTVLIERRL
jgi:hypothetical protein